MWCCICLQQKASQSITWNEGLLSILFFSWQGRQNQQTFILFIYMCIYLYSVYTYIYIFFLINFYLFCFLWGGVHYSEQQKKELGERDL